MSPPMELQNPHQSSHLLPKPSDWFSKLLSLQSDLFYNSIVFVSSPIFSLLSVATESYHRAEEAKSSGETTVQSVPSSITHGGTVLLKKIVLGFLAVVHVFMVLTVAMVVAALLGIGLVRMMLEEPVFVREKLFFDYTNEHPTAELYFGRPGERKELVGVPVGHTYHVSLVLLLPESDFNRHIGVFQVNAEVLSSNGFVIARSSHPIMLRFRSLPVRLARTFFLGVPLLLGLTSETQKLQVEMLNIKEGYLRTKAIRVSLVPRSGTSYLPQLYEAEILIKSELPWTKRLVHNWKWTLYVWASMYVYIILLIILGSCFRPVLFPLAATISLNDRRGAIVEMDGFKGGLIEGDRERREDVLELIRKWQQSRSKRQAMVQRNMDDVPETVVGSSAASSMSLTRDETSAVLEEEVGDSESVCLEH